MVLRLCLFIVHGLLSHLLFVSVASQWPLLCAENLTKHSSKYPEHELLRLSCVPFFVSVRARKDLTEQGRDFSSEKVPMYITSFSAGRYFVKNTNILV